MKNNTELTTFWTTVSIKEVNTKINAKDKTKIVVMLKQIGSKA